MKSNITFLKVIRTMYYKKVVLQFLRKNYVSTILPIILLFQVFFYFHAIALS